METSTVGLTFADTVRALFIGALGRDISDDELPAYVGALEAGMELSTIVRNLMDAPECRARTAPVESELRVTLPDLVSLYPDRYSRRDDGTCIYHAVDAAGVAEMERLIKAHRYYDSFGIWSPVVDLDKRVTAAVVASLGPRTCLELGCFTGTVLQLMRERGIAVQGLDVSHRAFILAATEIHESIRFGDLLDVTFDRRFDAFLAMDVLEHLSPVKLDRYVARIAALLAPGGFAYVNSPMFGTDDVFGNVFQAYLPEWLEQGRDRYWVDFHCDARGWPMHGHLVWASPQWWEALFARHDLVRDREIERMVHRELSGFFDDAAPARRSLFVLRRSATRPEYQAIDGRLATLVPAVLAGAARD